MRTATLDMAAATDEPPMGVFATSTGMDDGANRA